MKNKINEKGKILLAVYTPSENGDEIQVIRRNLSIETNFNEDFSQNVNTKIRDSDEAITINKQAIQRLLQDGSIPEDTGNALKRIFTNQEELIALSNQSKIASSEDLEKAIKDSIQQSTEDLSKTLNTLMDYVTTLHKNTEDYKLPSIFKRNVDPEKSIGITKVLMDRLYYLPKLLDNAQLKRTSTGDFVVFSMLENSEKSVGTIGLEYSLSTKDEETAKEYFNIYIKSMRNDALPAWLAYWAAANDEGYFDYFASLADIMRHALKNNKRHPSVNEKKRFWELSTLLANTQLTLTFKIEKEKKYITIKHPLLKLGITASKEIGQENDKGYPDKVYPRVLDPNTFKNTATLATEISRGTIKMRSEDIMMALTIQIKASQNRDGTEPLKYDEAFLMEKAGLAKTYNANPTVARQRLEKKLDKIIEAGGIDDWEKNKRRILIRKRTNKK